MANMCDRCPRRDMALLFELMGEKAHAERIRGEGCPRWWAVTETNEHGAVRVREACESELLPEILWRQGARLEEAMQTAQSGQNIASQGFSAMLKMALFHRVEGDGERASRALPEG